MKHNSLVDANVKNVSGIAKKCEDTDAGILGCFELSKVYDWARLNMSEKFSFNIPKNDMEEIYIAINAGHKINFSVNIPHQKVDTFIAGIERNSEEEQAYVTIGKLIELDIIIIDEFSKKILLQLTKVRQVFHSTKLCLPEPLDENNITSKLLWIRGRILGINRIESFIMLEVSLCENIKVALDVIAKAKILAYCPARELKSSDGGAKCDFEYENTYR